MQDRDQNISLKSYRISRQQLGLSQSQLVKRLGVQDQIHYSNVSKYELNKNEPPLGILLAYARTVGISVEEIIDDELELRFRDFHTRF